MPQPMPWLSETACRAAAAVAALTLVAAAPAGAAPDVVSNASPGGFITACGGISSTTGAAAPGADLEAFYGGPVACQSQVFVSGTASANAAFDNGTLSNSAHGIVGMGFMMLAASSVSPNAADFPYGSVHAGWEDTLLLDAAGYTGQAGTMQVSVQIAGSWVLSGFAGGARVTVRPYAGDERIVISGATHEAQYGSSFFPDGVDETVQFTLPFVFGEAFDAGMFAVLRAGLRSTSGVPGLSTADADFMNTITWQGIGGVFAGGVPVPQYNLASASGIDWHLPVTAIPEAPVWLTLLGGLAALRLRGDGRRVR